MSVRIHDMDEQRWVYIYTASGMLEASIITGRLESEGIPTRLKYDAAGPIYGITIDGLGEVKIFVSETDEARAKDILLKSFEEGEIPWDTPSE
ncbi:MAG: DUF2007 domain-containing protein [Syntrophales bacterium]|nr:DUF2007 domain-containing protein [Syntrophales bacterium]